MFDTTDFLADFDSEREANILTILTDPWVITGTVKWSFYWVQKDLTVAVGLGPNILHCRVFNSDYYQGYDAAVSILNEPNSRTVTCAAYRNKMGRLAFEKIEEESGQKWRVELFHDHSPLTPHTSGKRLHLLVKISAVHLVPTPDQPRPLTFSNVEGLLCSE